MTMSSKEASEYTARVARENREKLLARIAKAKASAPPDKEPLDIELIKRKTPTAALGIMTEEELVLRLEDLYYVDHSRYRTNEELIELISTIAQYE